MIKIRFQVAVESEFQADGAETVKLCYPCHDDSQQCRILKSQREQDHRRDRPVVIDTGMHISVRYDGTLRRR